MIYGNTSPPMVYLRVGPIPEPGIAGWPDRAATQPLKRMSLRVCLERGCATPTNQSRCQRHRKAKRKAEDKRRPSAVARGYDAKWRRTRATYLRMHPVCEDERGCIEMATDVDHIDGLGPNGPQGHDEGNLRAYCHRHHSQRTARDQKGGWHA